MARAKLPKWAIKKAGGINKKAWRLARAGRKRSASKSRKTRASPKRRSMARKRLVTPHPSITGMAAGFSIFDDLNKGDVVGAAISGNVTAALNSLSANAQDLIKSEPGRKSLVQAIGIAAIGSFARKALPGTKLGGKRIYLTI